MEPIFNFFTQTVCWLEGKIAFSNDGRPIVFIKNEAVFAVKNGYYLGQFNDGVFRDRLGFIVAFHRGAWWRKSHAKPQVGRMPPRIQSRAVPVRAYLPASPPRPARPFLSRSTLDWKRFVMGCEAKRPWKTRR